MSWLSMPVQDGQVRRPIQRRRLPRHSELKQEKAIARPANLWYSECSWTSPVWSLLC
ncbi:hypothetical protein DAI22_12g113350 [Oryza sativa Japonica Group]|nr:hypothetical protein DAI22_12g113350 [Oryza sativa Japonica Group]